MDASIKQTIEGALARKDYAVVSHRCRTDKRFWNALQSYLYETDENLRWPAIEAIAALLKGLWHDGDKERVREYIRRLLWLLNEESGSIGWSAPEVIAETIVSIPALFEPYASIMITSALTGETMLDSILWAIGRLGKRARELIVFSRDKVLAAFDSNSPQTLGLATWAVGEVGFAPALAPLTKLRNRKEIARIYIDSRFQEKPVGEWAEEAILKIREY